MTTFVIALRLVCYIDSRPIDGLVSVRLLSAPDWNGARLQALNAGTALEQTYANAGDETVEWRFVQVLTIDELPSRDLLGEEIYSYRRLPEPADDDPKQVSPERAPTGQAGV